MVKSEELVGLNKIQFWNKQGLVVEKIWLQAGRFCFISLLG